MAAYKDDLGSSPETTTFSGVDPRSKKNRVKKKVVSFPAPESETPRQKAGGEAAPPSDSWTWRKYGQKPIKGSPYPRGYYRCSSSKGCPARKQVERSCADPTMFTVTYSSDHNHQWPPAGKIHHNSKPHIPPSVSKLSPTDPTVDEPPASNKFEDFIAGEPSMLIPDDFRWPSISSGAAGDGLLVGPLFGGWSLGDECDEFGSTVDEEEEALFAGLGELPECSVIFRRGVLNRQMRGGDDAKLCQSRSCCGSTG